MVPKSRGLVLGAVMTMSFYQLYPRQVRAAALRRTFRPRGAQQVHRQVGQGCNICFILIGKAGIDTLKGTRTYI